MKMNTITRHILSVGVLLLALHLGASAQQSMLFEESNSPLETEYNTFSPRWETQMRDRLLSNPAIMRLEMDSLRHFFNDNPKAAIRIYRMSVEANLSLGKMTGDYQPVHGDRFKDFTVKANGVMKTKKGMLYGKAFFTSGMHKDVNWNILRSPEAYWPYVVADSTGGNMSYETYSLICAYSFRIAKKWDMGVWGQYKGDYAWRKTDPRIKDISSWFTLKAGAAYDLGHGYRLGFDVDYQLHLQNSEVQLFRSGQFAGFFMEYGFGMYDYIHSPIYNSMKNQVHMHSWDGNMQFFSNPTRAFRINATLGYGRDVMTTEENIYKLDLYRAVTNRGKVAMSALWNTPQWGVSLIGYMDLSQRKGRENVFERYVSSTVDGVDIYDYRKIGHQDRYTMTQARVDGQLKLSRYFGRTTTLSLLGGIDWYNRKEQYSETGYLIHNVLLTPQVGLEVTHFSKALECRLTVAYGKTSSPKHLYNVGVDLKRHTEYQHAFCTYAYYAYKADRVSLEAEISHVFKFARMGLRLQWLFVRGKRLDEVSYDVERYSSQVPSARKFTISPQPDVHNQHWLKVALFAEF